MIDREDSARRLGTILLIGLVALFAASKAILFDTLDPDLFWHLRVAGQIQRDGVRPLVDELSFMSVREPWTPYSWLAELAMKRLWDAAGWRGAVAAQALLQAGFVLLVALAARERSLTPSPRTRGEGRGEGRSVAEPRLRIFPAKPLTPTLSPGTGRGGDAALPLVLATALAAYLSLPYLSFRPVTMALVCLAACAVLILRDRRLQDRSRAVWWIVPITALTTNLHFFAAFVPLWCAVLTAGAFIERRDFRRPLRLTLAAAAACLATPLLPGVMKAVLHYGRSDPMVSAPIIAEFQPPFGGVGGIVTALLLLGTVACCLRRRQELSAGEWLWLCGSVLLMTKMGRFAPLAAIIAAPLLAATLPATRARALSRRPVLTLAALVLLVGSVRVVLAFPGRDMPLGEWLNRHGTDAPGFPAAAADFVRPLTPRRIINEFTWGGYLAWSLGPQTRVFVDGRTQLYSADFWRRAYLSDPPDVTPLLRDAGASAAIVPVNRSRFREPLLSLGWTSAYRDDRAEVLLPPPPVLTDSR